MYHFKLRKDRIIAVNVFKKILETYKFRIINIKLFQNKKLQKEILKH